MGRVAAGSCAPSQRLERLPWDRPWTDKPVEHESSLKFWFDPTCSFFGRWKGRMQSCLQARWAGGHCHCPPVPQALAVAAWAVGEQQIQPVPLAKFGMAKCGSGTAARAPAEGTEAATARGLNGSQKMRRYCKKSSCGSVGSLG